MASLLNIGLTGLNVAQASLLTTGHNISSAGVAGYNRQQVLTTTNDPQFSGAGFFGQGTRISDVKRLYSQFLENQVLSAATRHSELDSYSTQISQIDNMLADASAGLSPALQDFFKGVQDVGANPGSIPARQAMLSSAQALSSRFQSMFNRLDEIRSATEAQIDGSVSTINSLASSLAEINLRISAAKRAGDNVEPNDLLDQRNALIAELNKQVRVTTLDQADGTTSIFMGTGQPLVVGGQQYTLSTAGSANDPTRKAIYLQIASGSNVAIPDAYITGGSLGGLLRFREESLDTTENALGQIAAGLVTTFNAQHRLGQDLDGNMGLDFFTSLSPHVQNLTNTVTSAASAATLSTSYGTIANLTKDDYILSYDGTNYSLVNQTSGSTVYSGATLPSDVDGITVSVASGAIIAGDRFLIQPTRFAARDINVALSDPRLIAAASPIRTAAASANSGSGAISAGSVVSLTGIASTSPHTADVTLTYDSSVPGFVLGGAAAGTLAYDPTTDAAGKSFTLASPNVSITMSGVPANGDVFRITDNQSGISDNRNAVALAALQSSKTLIGGSANYQSAYSQLVSSVGTKTREVDVGLEAQEGLLTQAQSAQQSLSGVNLDEEAANLVRFQQAYQASARVMQIASTLFSEVLGIGR